MYHLHGKIIYVIREIYLSGTPFKVDDLFYAAGIIK